jgi:uncharacterized phage infection (PIP) family protein YhgE
MGQQILDSLRNQIGYVNLFCYSLFVVWGICSIRWILKLKKSKNPTAVNPYLYEAIPGVFTTLGVFGTFVGIFFGLQDFDVKNITDSIPTLLSGLKTAFLTSIVGIILSFIFGRISQNILNKVEKESATFTNNELSALHEIIKLLKDSKTEISQNLQTLNKSLIGDTTDSISTQIVKLRNQLSETQNGQKKQIHLLDNIYSALGGDDETSLLIQIQKLRAEQNDYSQKTKKYIEWIVKSMNDNNNLISKKFDEFSEMLAKNNTEALVNVMKQATEEFNKQMTSIVEKLVQENFQELNNSVQRMNQWQQENKEMITQLTNQFKSVSEDFTISSTAIKEITTNTTKLTNENSHLSNLIKELQKVMIEDTKYQEIVNKLTDTIDTLKENTDAFDETTNKLNNWVKNQMNFSDSVAKLLTRLEEIEKIKDINDVFWNNTKEQLNKGVNVIANASQRLSNDLENLNVEFYGRLNDTLQNLDTLIQRIIANYKR